MCKLVTVVMTALHQVGGWVVKHRTARILSPDLAPPNHAAPPSSTWRGVCVCVWKVGSEHNKHRISSHMTTVTTLRRTAQHREQGATRGAHCTEQRARALSKQQEYVSSTIRAGLRSPQLMCCLILDSALRTGQIKRQEKG